MDHTQPADSRRGREMGIGRENCMQLVIIFVWLFFFVLVSYLHEISDRRGFN